MEEQRGWEMKRAKQKSVQCAAVLSLFFLSRTFPADLVLGARRRRERATPREARGGHKGGRAEGGEGGAHDFERVSKRSNTGE